MGQLRALRREEIEELRRRGCTAESWESVLVHPEFDPRRLERVRFSGRVEIGDLRGEVAGPDQIKRPCGILNAVLKDCTVGDGCRIANVGGLIAGYDIGENVLIENVGEITLTPPAAFGNGTSVSVLNEGGGREVILCNELSAQLAYLTSLYRFRPALIEALDNLARRASEEVASDRGRIGAGSAVISVQHMHNVWIGEAAAILGASRLENGTILSEAAAPTIVGAGVTACDFIIAEGASVRDGVILEKVFVGQGCRLGKQFSAENSLFFANCEGFHGEAVSVFAGPYTVTHHKSTLLIAGLFSFYNAGSGTNQSNHRYKLGPVHEGKLLRGTKTGSFAYLMWPCAVGPFSVVMGKHSGTFDTTEFPFSHIEAQPDGRATLVPGLNLLTVGVLRDGAKWPARDRRSATVKRDAVSFPVLNPYTVGLMRRGRDRLAEIRQSTARDVEQVSVRGVLIARPLLRTGERYYKLGIELYLLEKLFLRLEAAQREGRTFGEALACDPEAQGEGPWEDVSGLLVSARRLSAFLQRIESGEIDSVRAFNEAVARIQESYEKDEWAWVRSALGPDLGVEPEKLDGEGAAEIAKRYSTSKGKYIRLVLADAEKEFDPSTRTGYGLSGGEEQAAADFEAVRGRFETNSFVRELNEELEQLEDRVRRFRERLSEGS